MYSAGMERKQPIASKTIRVFPETQKRLRAAAYKRKITIAELIEEMEKNIAVAHSTAPFNLVRGQKTGRFDVKK